MTNKVLSILEGLLRDFKEVIGNNEIETDNAGYISVAENFINDQRTKINRIKEPQDKTNNTSRLNDNTIVLWIPEHIEDSYFEYEYLSNKIKEGYMIENIHKISNERHKYYNWTKLKLKKTVF